MCKEHSADCTYQGLGQYTATTYRYHLSASDSLTPPFANTLLLHCSYSVLHSHLCRVTVSRTSLAPFGAFVRFRCNRVLLLCDRHEAKVPQKGAGRPPWRCGDRYRDSTQSRPRWTNSGRLFDQTVWVWQIHLISYLISYPISYLISYVSILFHILFHIFFHLGLGSDLEPSTEHHKLAKHHLSVQSRSIKYNLRVPLAPKVVVC